MRTIRNFGMFAILLVAMLFTAGAVQAQTVEYIYVPQQVINTPLDTTLPAGTQFLGVAELDPQNNDVPDDGDPNTVNNTYNDNYTVIEFVRGTGAPQLFTVGVYFENARPKLNGYSVQLLPNGCDQFRNATTDGTENGNPLLVCGYQFTKRGK